MLRVSECVYVIMSHCAMLFRLEVLLRGRERERERGRISGNSCMAIYFEQQNHVKCTS